MKWYDPDPEQCPWAKAVLLRRAARKWLWENQLVIILGGRRHGRVSNELADWLYSQYEKSGDTAWLALGNRILKDSHVYADPLEL